MQSISLVESDELTLSSTPYFPFLGLHPNHDGRFGALKSSAPGDMGSNS